MAIAVDPKLVRSVEAAEALCELPAVPTRCWPDDASSCLARLQPAGLCATAILQLEGTGTVRCIEASGAVGPRAHAGEVDTVRDALHRLRSIGLGTTGQPVVGRLEELCGPNDWRTTPLGRLAARIGATGVLAALSPLESGPDARWLLAVIFSMGLPFSEEDANQLRAVSPLLIRRTRMAIGQTPAGPGGWLTDRERVVLEQLTLGKSVRQIADDLGRSPHTVHDHVKALHRKLNASSRGELIARALGHLGVQPQREHLHAELKPIAQPINHAALPGTTPTHPNALEAPIGRAQPLPRAAG